MGIFLTWLALFSAVAGASAFYFSGSVRQKNKALEGQLAASLAESRDRQYSLNQKELVIAELEKQERQIPELNATIGSLESQLAHFKESELKLLASLCEGAAVSQRLERELEKRAITHVENLERIGREASEALNAAIHSKNMMERELAIRTDELRVSADTLAKTEDLLLKANSELAALRERLSEYSSASLILKKSTSVLVGGVLLDNRKNINSQAV